MDYIMHFLAPTNPLYGVLMQGRGGGNTPFSLHDLNMMTMSKGLQIPVKDPISIQDFLDDF